MSEAKCRRELIKAFMKPDKKSMKLHEALAELREDGSNYVARGKCKIKGRKFYINDEWIYLSWVIKSLPQDGWQVVEVGDE